MRAVHEIDRVLLDLYQRALGDLNRAAPLEELARARRQQGDQTAFRATKLEQELNKNLIDQYTKALAVQEERLNQWLDVRSQVAEELASLQQDSNVP
jgi:signal transduction histidine kinase